MPTREETEAFIAKANAILSGPMSNLERRLLAADRRDAQTYLATLPPPSETAT